MRAADLKYDKEYEAFESAIQPYHDPVAAARREIESLRDAPKKELREATKKKAAAEKVLTEAVRRLRPKDPFADLWAPHYDAEGYDEEGYDKHGYNRDGCDEEGNEREEE